MDKAISTMIICFAMLTYAVAASHDTETFVRVCALIGIGVVTVAGLTLFGSDNKTVDKRPPM